MKKKLLAMFICFTLAASCFGCGVSYQEASDKTADKAVYGNYKGKQSNGTIRESRI